MSVADGLQHSLAGMGFTELALAFVGLTGYALALNGALGARFRGRAAVTAVLAAAAFCVFVDPWTYGVVFVALAIGAMGLFVASVWAVSALCGFGARETPVLETPSTFAEDLDAEPVPAPAAVAMRPATTGRPIHSA
jgi:hypothetical protein